MAQTTFEKEDRLYRLMYPQPRVGGRRFTLSTPALPDVWLKFGSAKGAKADLLLTPHNDATVEQLVVALKRKIERPLPYNESHVLLLNATLEELLTAVLPLSSWWRKLREKLGGDVKALVLQLATLGELAPLFEEKLACEKIIKGFTPELLQAVRIASLASLGNRSGSIPNRVNWKRAVESLGQTLVVDPRPIEDKSNGDEYPLWGVSLNRQAQTCVTVSRQTVKADAAIRVFNVDTSGVRWAVLDTGIDADHPAFGRRVVKTYDFTRLTDFMRTGKLDNELAWWKKLTKKQREQLEGEVGRDLTARLASGRLLDWRQLMPLLEVPPGQDYEKPTVAHGTHVAGIIGANWENAPEGTDKVVGLCPQIEFYDLRVFKGEEGDEFTILAALQFVRFLNSSKDKRVIHGVNLSMSLKHDVRSFACGRTPICQECERLVASGVVVVAAAGNQGFQDSEGAVVRWDTYRDMSVTDPGNADCVITVGSTHRDQPHNYGVSFFSSRGPTGDGRMKPDILAPGEKIRSTAPGEEVLTLDGTSMAAPHVSGAAALLIARHQELSGKPTEIKRILCSTATDLGRERRFQGAGLVDVLRALQSV